MTYNGYSSSPHRSGGFTTAQAIGEGASRTQLSRMAARGRIEPVSYGAYRMADGEETPMRYRTPKALEQAVKAAASSRGQGGRACMEPRRAGLDLTQAPLKDPG